MAEMLDLESLASPAASRDEVVARLRRHEQEIRKFLATALYIYGSAARDELRPDSDVDIFIDYDPEGQFSFVELIRLEEYLLVLLGRDIDFTTRDGLHPRIKSRIAASSRRVF